MRDFCDRNTRSCPKGAIPPHNLIIPPPNQFTHELIRVQPYHFSPGKPGAPADGELPAGTKVNLLVHDKGHWCWVVDGRGLYVEIDIRGLRKLD